MKAKMNWGRGLILVFIAFGAMMSMLVYRCMRSPVELVAKEYYKDELAYQEVIDARQRAGRLSGGVQLACDSVGVRLLLPTEMKHAEVRGTINFYCPADASRDRHLPLHVDEAAQQRIAAGVVPTGHYIVKIRWTTAGVEYFEERPFDIM